MNHNKIIISVLTSILILGLIVLIPVPVESAGPYDNICVGTGIGAFGSHWICVKEVIDIQHVLLTVPDSGKAYHMIAFENSDSPVHITVWCFHGIPSFCSQIVEVVSYEIRH